jgi:drug/metabolite transporter (DMT)-like permease
MIFVALVQKTLRLTLELVFGTNGLLDCMKRKSAYTSGLYYVHASVLLFGLVGLFAELLPLPPTVIVLGRVSFAALALWLGLRWQGLSLQLTERRHYGYFFLLGALLAAHWVALFAAIQYASVAVGLLTFATFPVFTTLLEPLFYKTKPKGQDLLLALLTLLGVALVLPTWDWQAPSTTGVLLGIFSGASFALLSILNRRWVADYSPWVIAWYQDASAALLLLPFLLGQSLVLTPRDWGLLLLLGVVFTALAHGWFIRGLQTVSAQTASLIASLEPVYGIVAAALLLGEWPTARTLLGGGLILLVTTYATWAARRKTANFPTSNQLSE